MKIKVTLSAQQLVDVSGSLVVDFPNGLSKDQIETALYCLDPRDVADAIATWQFDDDPEPALLRDLEFDLASVQLVTDEASVHLAEDRHGSWQRVEVCHEV